MIIGNSFTTLMILQQKLWLCMVLEKLNLITALNTGILYLVIVSSLAQLTKY